MNFRLSLNFRFLRMQLHGRQLLALNGNPIMLLYPRHGLVFLCHLKMFRIDVRWLNF